MKKIIISFLLLLTTGLSTAFATNVFDPDPNQEVLDEFKKEFGAAQNVSWDKQNDYEKATFLLGGSRIIAWFNSTGQLEGCVRDIFFDQLPLSVMMAFDKRFTAAEILEVREITNAEGTSYRIRLAAKRKKYSIKIGSTGSISEIEKLAK